MKKYLITAGTLIGGATLLCAIALQINKYPLVEAYAGGGTPTCRACGDSNIKCLVANTADGTDNESPCSYQELYMTRKSCSTSRKGLEPKDNISFNMYSGVVSGPNQKNRLLFISGCLSPKKRIPIRNVVNMQLAKKEVSFSPTVQLVAGPNS